MMLSSPLYSYGVGTFSGLLEDVEYIVTKPVAWLFLTMAQSLRVVITSRQQANGRLERNV